MPNLTYEEIMSRESEAWEERMKRIEAHKPLVHIATEYGLRFSKRIHSYSYGEDKKKRSVSMTAAFDSWCVGLSLNLYLGENDSIIKDVGWIIEDLKEHPRLNYVGENDYVEAGWKGWEFSLSNNTTAKLLVRCWFESSNTCKVVGTGEFEEKKELVCEDTA